MVQLERERERERVRLEGQLFFSSCAISSVLNPPSDFGGGLLGSPEQPDGLKMRCYPPNHDVGGPNWILNCTSSIGSYKMKGLIEFHQISATRGFHGQHPISN